MHAEQRARAQRELTSRGIERALFAHPFTVTWLTGFAPAPQLGPTPFAGGPALVWYAGGEFTLIAVDAYAAEVLSRPLSASALRLGAADDSGPNADE